MERSTKSYGSRMRKAEARVGYLSSIRLLKLLRKPSKILGEQILWEENSKLITKYLV
jgi:hypothetical protein